MDQTQLTTLQEQYHDYFIIEHAIRINVSGFTSATEPDEATFETMIPEPFRMAGELATLDKSALKSLNKLGELAEELANYLRIQAKKIDSMMRYVLLQQDDPASRFITQAYGGSALCYLAPAPRQPGELIEVKLFLAENDGAVYCLARVLSADPVAEGFLIKATYSCIREQDRELIVRASLHQQSRMLKRKAELRAQQQEQP